MAMPNSCEVLLALRPYQDPVNLDVMKGSGGGVGCWLCEVLLALWPHNAPFWP